MFFANRSRRILAIWLALLGLIVLALLSANVFADTGAVSLPDTPNALKFGNVVVGSSKIKTLKLTTYGGDLYVDQIWIEGLNASDFQIVKDNMTGGPYPPGTEITARIRFAPLAPGKRIATFRGQCHAVGGGACEGAVVDLTGNGIAPSPTPTPTNTRTPTPTPTNTLTPTPTLTPTATPTLIAGCTSKPAVAKKLKPADGTVVSTRRVKLDWNDVGCLGWYEIQVRKGSPTGKIVDERLDLVVSEYTTKRLATGNTYYWRVWTCNALGCQNTKWLKFVIP
jgi:hypothetical protein